jgi:hypothetical protein
MASATPPNGLYHRFLLGWLTVTALYFALPTLALLLSSHFYVHMPLPLTYIVLLGAIIAAALYLEEGVRQRAMLRALGAAGGLVAAAILLYVTFNYCPG